MKAFLYFITIFCLTSQLILKHEELCTKRDIFYLYLLPNFFRCLHFEEVQIVFRYSHSRAVQYVGPYVSQGSCACFPVGRSVLYSLGEETVWRFWSLAIGICGHLLFAQLLRLILPVYVLCPP